MKKFYGFKTLLILVFFVSIKGNLTAQNFNLIDVNKITNSYPANNQYSNLNSFAFLNNIYYFTANDGTHGNELWSSDGTEAGTQLVKDVNPGTPSSYVSDIIVSGGKLFFVASDNVNGSELWVSDGTETGTQLVADFASGTLSSNPAYLTDVNGILFFTLNYFDASTGNFYNQLWKTDGTPANTTLVADFYSFSYNFSQSPQQLVNVDGKLFFTLLYGSSDKELFVSDGTPEGTHIVADINPFSSSYPSNLTGLNGLLYFAANDGSGGKLWVTDGTAEGTHAVKNDNNVILPLNQAFYFGDIDSFAVKNNVLYFQGYTDATGYELCKYNPLDPEHTVRIIKDIIPGSTSTYPSFITTVNNEVFFTIGPAGGDAQLWKTDGTKGGTVLVKSINPGGINYYYGLIDMNGTLLFAYANNTYGFELWRSDGTTEGTTIVKDISPGVYSSYPGYFTYKNNIFIFSANNGTNGRELWRSDGTEAGTTLIKDINTTTTANSNPFGFTKTKNNKIIFNAFDDNNGSEPWVTDATDAGTKLLQDILPGSDGSYPQLFTNFKGDTYFIASNNQLWKTNGTKAGTRALPVPPLIDVQTTFIYKMISTDNLLYYITYNYQVAQTSLWRTDGTAEGTYVVVENLPFFFDVQLSSIGNTLYFTNNDFIHGTELWKTDGTQLGTVIVKDIIPDGFGSGPVNLFNFKNKLYFIAYNGNSPFRYLYTSDGTEAGTYVVKQIDVQAVAFAKTNNQFFLYAQNVISKGVELFASDGTSAGTKMVKDINHGFTSSNINTLISGDTLVYFIADDGKHGFELWKSNGTSSGTQLVKDISKGFESTFLGSYANAHDKLFFLHNDTLWQSDGTKANTHKVEDNNLIGVTNLSNVTAIGDTLLFVGFTPAIGYELYIGSASAAFAPVQTIASNDAVTKVSSDVFNTTLLTNPVKAGLRFSVFTRDAQAAQINIVDVGGRILAADKKMLLAGTTIFNYNSSNWAPGTILININTAKTGASLLKAVK